MRKDEYLAIVTAWIKNKHDKRDVCAELGEHIDELTDFYISNGLSAEEAEEKAVAEMGETESVSEAMGSLHNRMKTSTKVLIILFILFIVLPSLIIFIAIAGVVHFNNSKPDSSKDSHIPAGYIETDGEQGYGAGDWEVFSYYLYDEKPQLDSNFKPVTEEDELKIRVIFDHFKGSGDDTPSLLNREKLANCISTDDYYYLVKYNGEGNECAYIYYYDTQTKVLYMLDYCW